MKTNQLVLASLISATVATLGCGGGSSSGAGGGSAGAGGGGVSGYEAEIEPFAMFSSDTGAVPSGSPVTVDFKWGANGKVTLNAPASGHDGTFAIAADITATNNAVSTLPGAAFTGPLKGVPNFDIKISGSTPFDATVMTATTLTAQVSPSALISGLNLADLLGVPGLVGTLDVKLDGGTVTPTFTPSCNSNGAVSGSLGIAGSLNVSGTLTAGVSLLGISKTQSFPIPSFAVPLALPATTVNFKTAQDPQGIGCGAAGSSSDGGAAGTGGAAGSSSDGGAAGTGGTTGNAAFLCNNNNTIPTTGMSVSIEGAPMTIVCASASASSLSSATSNVPAYDLNVVLSDGKAIQGTFTQAGTGCGSAAMIGGEIDLESADGKSTAFSQYGADCGLVVTSLPINGANLAGSFSGNVVSYNQDGSIGTTTAVAWTFAVTLPAQQ